MIDHTDLVMLDIKQINDDIHRVLIGVSNYRPLRFAEYLAARNKPTWIRYVVVPGYTDDDDLVSKGTIRDFFVEHVDKGIFVDAVLC